MTKSALLHFLLALFVASTAFAVIGADQQMLLGNPSGATADVGNHTHYLVNRAQYALDYNDTTREPNWVSWNYTTADSGSSGRSDNFFQDTTLPAGFYQVRTTDYSGSGFDRGHMCPSADRTVSTADNEATFFMSNMVPQTPDNNQGVWAGFETYCRTLAALGNEVLITSGPSGFAGTVLGSGVGVPGYTWKIAVIVPVGAGSALTRITADTRVIAIKVPNIAGVRSTPWQNFVTSAAQIEGDTGYTFFTALSASVAGALRAKVDGQSAVGAPAITTQPAAQTVAVGGTATFSVTASGNAMLTYQWFKDGTEIAGATSATLTLTGVQLADMGTYAVVVANSVGSATSGGAALAVSGVAPSIISSPAGKSVPAGSTTTLGVSAAGSPTLTYQWRRGGSNLADGAGVSGATTALLTLANVQAAAAGTYDVVVGNGVGSATSAGAVLSVTPAAPAIVTAPAAQTTAIGNTVTFTVAATGTEPLAYQWRKGGANLTNGGMVSGATTATLTLTGVDASAAGSYDVVIGNGVGADATSSAALLTINALSGPHLNYGGGEYTQNFDTLPASGTFTFSGAGPFELSAAPPGGVSATGLTGWTFAKFEGSGAVALFNVGTGTSGTGSVYSFGASASTERALGFIGSNTTNSRAGLTLVNSTGTTITQFTLGYTGEQWRNGGNTAAQSLKVYYGVGAADIMTGTFTEVPQLQFTSPITGTTAAALDGNASANRTVIAPVTVTGLTWAPGQALTLRWDDTNDSGNDHGLAIDDLTFIAGDGPGRLSNLSIRTTAGADSATLIVGFVTSGGTQNSSLLVRAAGPALTPYGVTGVLANPALTVNNMTPTQIATNDDWSSSLTSTFATVGAFAWTNGSPDAALTVAVAPAPYTAVVTGAGATGTALAEIYDVNTAYAAANPRLVNVSARSQVGTGDNIMIAGFVITGGSPLQVLVRGVGPKLAFYGVTGVLADPQLAIYRGGTLIASSDDWSSSLTTTFAQVGAFALDASSKDSALLVTLPPGVYTAQVSGVGGTTGVALVEVYSVP